MKIKFFDNRNFSTAQRIALSFAIVILVGSILLCLPISLLEDKSISYIDALFVSTSATCVTGLTPVVIDTTFNWFGKIVILILIQIGGLGLMTIMASFVLFLRNRIPLKERHALSEMLNRSDLFNFPQFIKSVIKITFIIEAAGALLLLPVLVERSGWFAGIGQSIFVSISAFCNAGFDLFGATSLMEFQHNLYFQIIIMLLIVFGGLGFAVWADIYDFFHNLVLKKRSFTHARRKFSTHSKLVLTLTIALILIPAVIIYLIEMYNPFIFEGLNFIESTFAMLFQSITLRTAGFYTIDFSKLRYVTLLFMIPIMFIGGSSGGTAGGVKTTTFYIAVAYLISVIRGKKELILFKRRIDKEIIIKAFTLILINAMVLLAGIFLISLAIPQEKIMEYAFEAGSALGTVGISTGVTSSASTFVKIVLTGLMYVGRIGIVTLVFSMRGTQSKVSGNVGYPTGNVIVG